MNFGQITQGLRADIMAQAAGQGMNVTQLLESGVSFADIMLMIVQNQQSVMPQGAEQGQFSQMSDMQANTEENLLKLMQDFQNLTGNSQVLNIQNPSDASEILNILNDLKNPIAQPDVQNVFEMTQGQNVQPDVEIVVENPQEDNPQSDIQNVVEMPQKQNVQPDVEIVAKNPHKQNVQNVVKMPQEQNVQLDVDNVVEIPQKQNVQNLEIVNDYDVNNKSETISQTNIPLYSQPVQTHDIRFAADVQQMMHNNTKSADFSLVQSNTDVQEMLQDTVAAQKLVEVLGVISPEILKSSENTASYTNNSFMNELMSVLPAEESEIKDSFDISESILKVDPLQLAGLLDFIGTGNSIPMVSDISANETFKSLEAVGRVDIAAEKSLFNPEEMIKSGEMEIVSYTPAEKNPQPDSSKQGSRQTDGETIDLARAMKTARETFKADISDDAVKFSEISASMVNSNPDEIAQKIDISFDRAYAELEMNKAKYGSADEQMYKGISENLEKGRSEFTVKLRPEGLGEILVKLVSDEGGKAILSLVASSEKTAELLNRESGNSGYH